MVGELLRNAAEVERRSFALKHLYVYPKLKISYTYIPKNACSSLKRTFGVPQGWVSADENESAHTMKLGWWLQGLSTYPLARERVVVIRDPFDRILSAYLNRFLMRSDVARDHAMNNGLARFVAPAATADDVTFADFVHYLAATPGRHLNEHWRPQSDFLIGSYTRIIRFSSLADDTRFLQRSGLRLADARGHSTSARMARIRYFWADKPASRLRQLRHNRGVLPAPANMYDDRLRELVARRYAQDVQLFASASVGART